MFTVTLVNLDPDARTAVAGGGPVQVGTLSPGELMTLLDTFVGVDSLENMKADPEIRVQTRRDRFIIRTGQNKLFLQDARKPEEPAFVVTAAEIIAELDGSAAAKRTAPPIPLPTTPDPWAQPAGTSSGFEYVPPPEKTERSRPWALIGLVLLLGGYLGYATWSQPAGDARVALVPLPTAERVSEEAALTGVYTTGSEPGQHGIILLGDGKLKLFQMNAQAAPGVVYGTYAFGRLDGKLHLATDQPGGLIKVVDRESLEFCGEIYRRVP